MQAQTCPLIAFGAVNGRYSASYFQEHLETCTQVVKSGDAFQLKVSAHTPHQLLAQWADSAIMLSDNT